jgi:hypothetical protein
MKLLLLPILVAIGLTGCASNDYQAYTQTQQIIAASRAEADIARYKALQEIAKAGDATAKVAAVMSIQQGAPSSPQPRDNLAMPESFGDKTLKWASVLFPSLTQIYGINRNSEVAIVNSNNNLEGKKTDNGMIVDLVQGRIDPIIGNKTDPDGATEEFLLYPR